ncbi:MAG: S-layer protein, partial [Clostridia bacterium]|nr:S-layer protein [Clostridia bacterium]
MRNLKKVLALVVVFAMMLSTVAFAAVPSDVKGTSYETAVARLSALGVITGYADGTFKPDNTITRAEFAAVVVRALGYETAAKTAGGATKFSDVAAGHWASGYINLAASLGVINGMPDGTFAPDANVTYDQAVTMIVRALGYEPAAQAKGGFPTGYLVIAAQEDITDDAEGVAGTPASRGIVAKLLDNSLEVPLMVQVGYGDSLRFVKSGTDGTKVETLLADKLKATKVEARVTGIPRTDTALEDNEIELTLTDEGATAKVVEVLDGFNFEGVYGTQITAYLNKDDVIISYTIDDTVKYDAVEIDGDELKLVGEDKTYKFVTDFDASDLAPEYDYAKVVLNKSNKIIFVEGFNWDDFLVVEEVEETVVFGYGEELDVEDYTIVKAGASISVNDLKKGDILFYNESAQYAEVFNKSVKGAIKKIYEDSFEVASNEYDYYNTKIEVNVKYLNEDDEIADFDADVAEQMQEEGDVEVFVDRTGAAVFVVGSLGDVVTTSF